MAFFYSRGVIAISGSTYWRNKVSADALDFAGRPLRRRLTFYQRRRVDRDLFRLLGENAGVITTESSRLHPSPLFSPHEVGRGDLACPSAPPSPSLIFPPRPRRTSLLRLNRLSRDGPSAIIYTAPRPRRLSPAPTSSDDVRTPAVRTHAVRGTPTSVNPVTASQKENTCSPEETGRCGGRHRPPAGLEFDTCALRESGSQTERRTLSEGSVFVISVAARSERTKRRRRGNFRSRPIITTPGAQKRK
ncbi:hypothetical protein EYF80_047411 [Liparis tanakae]|uniref:Uncharacterized protein n=1 Tax=Liparis tanakae TaxID=230148 RepID=A0A4Z2FN18_9TELE|nr:hypothetical protein EYF80_047411 [Liparis tanakae]